ncbi:hypothetical protein N7931_01525 [Catenovulum sp. 2E275]|uniref:hypothetical protein n=1 Tax=Catenovulum sp. 2E275 TaxID=2980497 RepID=UPI0021CFC044|nr:hypothetical protein [Catenovulum sp. 2E275]MCU4674299.1 hypothetical protein [Catenovulum sp. 2E275]
MDERERHYIEEGFSSYSAECGSLRNPYPVGTEEFNWFERGWVQAQKRSCDSFSTNKGYFSDFVPYESLKGSVPITHKQRNEYAEIKRKKK